MASSEPDKSWEHPWTTEEIRQHQNNWSLAGDVGLLRHLQQFSENLTERAQRTQSALDDLKNQLTEATVLVDNVANASLALANTQFIESRVHEDDPTLSVVPEPTETPSKESNEAETIANITESIRAGLKIMEEKYERVEVLESDSEDETEALAPSYILKPRDRYQNRPLPFVIGSERFMVSSRIGLESSSESSESEEDNSEVQDLNTGQKPTRDSSPLSSGPSSDFPDDTDERKQFLSSRTRSRDTLNSSEEVVTPGGIPAAPQEPPIRDSFAEELAKRLGSVLPSAKPPVDMDSSINRVEDDIFPPQDRPEAPKASGRDLFSSPGLFDEDLGKNLWRDEVYRKPPQNIVPPSVDVPPPLGAEEDKPRTAIDDLFGDDSEDSDDIFAPKSSSKTSHAGKNDEKIIFGSHLDVNRVGDDTMATSTPETGSGGGFFGDDDDDRLFASAESGKSNARASRRPPGALVSQADLLSSALGSRLFQVRQVSQDDSEDDESNPVRLSNTSHSVTGNRFGAEISGSSGIDEQQSSINSLRSPNVANWTPEMESTRLASEELYRERVTSDSLLNPKLLHRENQSTINSSVDTSTSQRQVNIQDSVNVPDTAESDLFDADDVFSPPPLPKNNSKSKSKRNSLFDDSDSGDELFSNTSSGSRSQKSSELAAQLPEKLKRSNNENRALFDDIFSENDVPDVDIFGSPPPLKPSKPSVKAETSSKPAGTSFERSSVPAFPPEAEKSLEKATKIPSIFDSDDDDDLFGSKHHVSSVFDVDDVDDLFPNLDRVTTKKDGSQAESSVKSEEKIENTQEKLEKNFETTNNKLFDDSDGDEDLFSPNFPRKMEALSVEKPKIEEILGEDLINNKKNVQTDEFVTDGVAGSKENSGKLKSEDFSEKSRKEPPKSLKIRLPIVDSSDEVNPAPRRAVSGKIKGLMGKIGDLKILSPTETPLLWRKTGDKGDSEDNTPDRDSEDGSSISIPSSKSSPVKQRDEPLLTEPPPLPPIETETAVSFDEPAQAETLATASKSRARIPTKRRPQSRHARKSALRVSGIDFDHVDTAEAPENTSIPSDDLQPSSKLNLNSEDCSDLSLGRENSTSTAKNTLLSPSTDEDDIFDVPPDLPEDSDGIFSRAPILSPEPVRKIPEKSVPTPEKPIETTLDPLQDHTHDSLRDPSQLFAFVTKTPSPEKGRGLLFNEDDSLFSAGAEKPPPIVKKSSPDIFTDDVSTDLFSGALVRPIRPPKAARDSLFDDSDPEDPGDDLFGSVSSKFEHSDAEGVDLKAHEGADDDEEDLFFDASEKPPSESARDDFSSAVKLEKSLDDGIFGDDDDNDDFSRRKIRSSAAGGLFFKMDNEAEDIFGKKVDNVVPEVKVKKSVLRDLKKTAEEIKEDPLSMLGDD